MFFFQLRDFILEEFTPANVSLIVVKFVFKQGRWLFIFFIFLLKLAYNMPKIYSMKRIKFLIGILTFVLLAGILSAQSLHIGIEDISLETVFKADGEIEGFMLYVRKKPGMNSVLLTETTRSADGMATNYAYRTLEWNEINGNERRMLDGKPLVSEFARYSIIDSTPENHPVLGEAFCLYIPTQIQYGYPWSRSGVVTVGVGTFINIRAFGALYGEYTDGYEDNPFMFDLGKPAENPPVPAALTDSYNPEAATTFDQIARDGGGSITYSKGPETITEDIIHVLEKLDPTRAADIVFALDTTGSMKDDVVRLRESLLPELEKLFAEFNGSVRLGLLLYRDYVDGYNYKGIPVKYYPFVSSLDEFKENLFDFTIRGNEGGDIPEAVYEALYGAVEFYSWNANVQRRVILIGDAEPHPKPRGSKKYTRELVFSTAEAKNVTIEAIITPDGKTSADRK